LYVGAAFFRAPGFGKMNKLVAYFGCKYAKLIIVLLAKWLLTAGWLVDKLHLNKKSLFGLFGYNYICGHTA
jgi:hypothetical protein